MQGWNSQDQSLAGIEVDKACEVQQEGLLQMCSQQKEDQGKYGSAAESGR